MQAVASAFAGAGCANRRQSRRPQLSMDACRPKRLEPFAAPTPKSLALARNKKRPDREDRAFEVLNFAPHPKKVRRMS